MSVLITGAAGAIGSALTARLPAYGWTVRGLDRVPVDGAILGDVTCPADLDAGMTGASAVVHLAGHPSEAPWGVLREANLEGAVQLFEAARRHGVPRVVYASSIHATGFTPVTPQLSAGSPARPDTLYGVSKVFGETLGRYYADRYGMRVACLRIGTFAPTPPDVWALASWLSPDDCARLVDACLRSPALTYALLWGVSANTRGTWSMDEGRALGYLPQDDSEAYADAVPAGESYPSDAFVGGGFTSPGFGIDEVLARS
ncbi:MAG: NAD-dependent dehydratase [Pseudonocardiales bacterium]|nr:MAG: NAD-dependent dehydratase [Pseudonocardiales bacterium]